VVSVRQFFEESVFLLVQANTKARIGKSRRPYPNFPFYAATCAGLSQQPLGTLPQHLPQRSRVGLESNRCFDSLRHGGVLLEEKGLHPQPSLQARRPLQLPPVNNF
jgi:hypothetical protein